MVVAQYRGKLCRGCRLQVTAPPWPSKSGNTPPILPLRPTLLSRAHNASRGVDDHSARKAGSVIFRALSGHAAPPPLSSSRKARVPKAQGPKAQGLKVLVFEGTRAQGARADGSRAEGVGVCVCV